MMGVLVEKLKSSWWTKRVRDLVNQSPAKVDKPRSTVIGHRPSIAGSFFNHYFMGIFPFKRILDANSILHHGREGEVDFEEAGILRLQVYFQLKPQELVVPF